MRKPGCVVFAISVFVLTAAVALAVTVDEATGKGAFVDRNGDINSIQYKAGVDDAGTIFGELQNVIHLPGPDLKFHGDVTCFDLVSPNTAVFGGPIDSSSDPSLVGMFYVVEVIDNAPDEIGIEITRTEPDCTKVNVRTEPLLRGSNHVH